MGADAVGYCESPRLAGFGGYERKHLENTYRKLGVHNRMQAAASITKADTAAV